jgi:shikimate dehydrogenase
MKQSRVDEPMTIIRGSTKLFGIFADPIAQVKAPAAFNEIIRAAHADAVFVPFHVSAEMFEAAVDGLRKLKNFGGFTLTLPHKRAAMLVCDRLGPTALACGAVNAVRVEADGSLTGETFDGMGMANAVHAMQALEPHTSVLIVGAGGAGRAIAFAMAQAGVGQLRIANRTVAQAEDLVGALRQRYPAVDVRVSDPNPSDADVAINATSLGLNGDGPLPFDPRRSKPDAVIADAVMEPAMTRLLTLALGEGRQVVPGKRMLEEQVRGMTDFLRLVQTENTGAGRSD